MWKITIQNIPSLHIYNLSLCPNDQLLLIFTRIAEMNVSTVGEAFNPLINQRKREPRSLEKSLDHRH
jgi:hypothetical protein